MTHSQGPGRREAACRLADLSAAMTGAHRIEICVHARLSSPYVCASLRRHRCYFHSRRRLSVRPMTTVVSSSTGSSAAPDAAQPAVVEKVKIVKVHTQQRDR